MGRRGSPRRGNAPRAPLATWVVAIALVVATASGCAAMERSEQLEPTSPPAERDWLTRPGSVQATFGSTSDVEVAVGAVSTTTTVPATTTTAPAPSTTRPPRVASPTTTTTSPPPSTTPPTTAAPAPPPTLPPTVMASSVSADARIDAALALVRIDWANMLPGWTLEFRGPRSGYQGVTFPQEHLIQVYVRASSTPALLAHVIAHEVAHAIDVTYLDDETRAGFSVMRGRDANEDWWAGDGASDFASGAGDWAESFSWWATAGVGDWRSELGPPPNPVQQMAISALVNERTGVLTPGVTTVG